MAVKPAGAYAPKEMEERILGEWKREKLAEKTLTEKRGKVFSFL